MVLLLPLIMLFGFPIPIVVIGPPVLSNPYSHSAGQEPPQASFVATNRDEWLAGVPTLLNRMVRIPARMQTTIEGEEIKVAVGFTVERDGKIRNVQIHMSSGQPEIDAYMVNAVGKIKLPPFPSDITEDELSFVQPMLIQSRRR